MVPTNNQPQKDGVYLKPATAEDETFVNNLTRATMRPYVEATWSDEPSREHYYFINRFQLATTSIIYCGKERAGRMTVTHGEKEIVLDDIHLLPQYQGQGIGGRLILDLLEEARGNNKVASLFVLKTNPAKKLYDRLGFKVYQESKERYYMRVEYSE